MTTVTVPRDMAEPVWISDFRMLVPNLEILTETTVLRAYERDAYPPAVKADVDGTKPVGHPDVVVRPRTTEDVVQIVAACRSLNIPLVPYGGGSGICGSALATEGGVVLDCKLMNKIEQLDSESHLVTVGAGILGTELEWQLSQQGFTCGHSPQSVGSSTVAGWVAHRGAGVYSTRYGKVDDLVQGLEVVLPSGQVLRTRAVPTSAAGPDLNRFFLGSEGTLGVITKVTLKVFRMAKYQRHTSWAVPDMASGIALGRTILHSGFRPAVVRLYDAVETRHLFGSVGLPAASCIVLVLDEGDPDLVDLTIRRVDEEATALGGQALGESVGEAWKLNRFSTAGLLRTLHTPHAIADALEVVNSYAGLASTYQAMTEAIRRRGFELGLLSTEVYGHASHFYDTGANIYVIFHAWAEAEADIAWVYNELVDAALHACHDTGGSLSHHHGVGISKSRLMADEWGAAGVELWRGVKNAIDPQHFMNPGDKVIPHE